MYEHGKNVTEEGAGQNRQCKDQGRNGGTWSRSSFHCFLSASTMAELTVKEMTEVFAKQMMDFAKQHE